MILVRILKRKDGASVVAAVAVGLVLYSLAVSITSQLTTKITSTNSQSSIDWKTQYLNPLVQAVLELIVLEILGWIYVWCSGSMKKK